jgi:hypothetical protein
VIKNDSCMLHSGLEVSLREVRNELRSTRAKLNRMEKLLWALTMAVGVGTVGDFVVPEGAAPRAVAWLVGAP